MPSIACQMGNPDWNRRRRLKPYMFIRPLSANSAWVEPLNAGSYCRQGLVGFHLGEYLFVK